MHVLLDIFLSSLNGRTNKIFAQPENWEIFMQIHLTDIENGIFIIFIA